MKRQILRVFVILALLTGVAACARSRGRFGSIIVQKLYVEGGGVDMLGNKIDLDDDNDTSITADTEDQIDIEINGSDDFQFTANTFTVRSGSKVNPENATNAGAVFAGTNSVAYTDTANKTMFVIPANADIIDWTFDVTTLFDDSTTDVVDCGTTSGDPDEYVDALDSSAAGVNRMGDNADMPDAGRGDVGASDITVLCKYTGGTGDASAGAATLIIEYIVD